MCQCVPLYLCYLSPLSSASIFSSSCVVLSSLAIAQLHAYVFHAISRIFSVLFCAWSPSMAIECTKTVGARPVMGLTVDDLEDFWGDEEGVLRRRTVSARMEKTSGVQTSFASLSDDSACSAGLELPERGWSRIVRADVVAGSGRYGEAARVFLEVMGHRRVQVGG